MTLFGKKIEESEKEEEEYIVPPLPFYEEDIESDEPEVSEEIPEREPEEPQKIGPRRVGWGEWVALAAITVVLSWLIQCSVFQAFNVPSRSMEPNLLIGDSVIVNKFAYGFYLPEASDPIVIRSGPRRGDVVAFVIGKEKKIRRTFSFDEYLIKRVAGVPGDVVEVRNGVTHINGIAVIERKKHKSLPAVNRDPERLRTNQYFLLGDNAEVSEDSRFFGTVSREAIIGKVVGIYWSRDKTDNGYKMRLNRIGKIS